MTLRLRFIGIGLLGLTSVPAVARDLPLHLIKLPAGFNIELYAADVPNARSMSMSPAGTLFVGSRHAGKVYAIRDTDNDGLGDKVDIIARGLNMPNGVAFYKGALYVAEINRILRFGDIENRLAKPPRPIVVSADFPSETHHGWKFIRIGPDEKLYVPIGAPCNVCIEYGYAVITRLNLDGSEHEIFAEGVRNTVGFDWHPDSKELWFTDNGRDQLGDDLPPDELNRAPDEGLHFGFPYCHAGEVLDPEFGLGHRCQEYVAPVQQLGPHVASLGMRFYTGKQFPVAYHKQVFIAEHGSWNRSDKSGYRLSLVSLKNNKAVAYETFAEGWLQGQQAWGRPVDIEHMSDGSLLVSDDKAGAIYRIYYAGKQVDTTPSKQSPAEPVAEQQALPSVMNNMIPEQRNIIQPTPRVKESDSIDTRLPNSLDVQQPQVMQEEVLPPGEKNSSREPGITDDKPYQSTDNKPQQQDKPAAVPPADIIEKIRVRTEQNNTTDVDPFSSVKKQTINQ